MKRRFVKLLTFILAAVMSVFVFACEKKEPYYGEQPTDEIEVDVVGSYRMYTRGEYVDGITLSLDAGGYFVYKMEDLLTKAGTYSRDINELQFTAIGADGAKLYMWGKAYEGIIKLGFYKNGEKEDSFIYMCKDGYAPEYPQAPDGSFVMHEMKGVNKYVFFTISDGKFEFVDYGTKTTGRVQVLDGETLFVLGESTFLRGKQIGESYLMEYDEKKVWFTKSGAVVENVFEYSEVKDKDENVIGYSLDAFTPGTGDSVEVPAEYNGKPVTAVGNNVFAGYAGKSIKISDGVTRIGESAFSSTAAAVTLPATLTHLMDRAFADYRGESISLPDSLDSLTAFGNNVFSGTGAKIVWGDAPTIKVIGMLAFASYRGESIKIPDSVELLGYGSFAECRAAIEWGDNPNLKTIDEHAFFRYPFRSITLPASVQRIEAQAFSECPDLVAVTFEDSASGWEATKGDTKKTLTVIDPASNAINLTDEYCEYQWKRL